MIKKISQVLHVILAVFACFFTVAFCGSVIIQIIGRTFLPRAASWTEEVARYCFIYAVAFAGGLAVQGNTYVQVDILTNLIPPSFKRIWAVFLNVLLCGFAVFFEVRCAFKFANLKARLVSTALEIPMQYIYFALLILFAMLAITYFLEILSLITGGKVKETVLQ
ncbi:MAG: TRAP transporter small permease [Spirochaetaceae bacterium]|jgi:TRAP-type C4-dicarboxylate transport system permease small subunit|nr:TRAP transporter small permease [Spirochaetaceae bacterium]